MLEVIKDDDIRGNHENIIQKVDNFHWIALEVKQDDEMSGNTLLGHVYKGCEASSF